MHEEMEVYPIFWADGPWMRRMITISSFSIGLALAVLFKFFVYKARQKKLQPMKDSWLFLPFHVLTPPMSLLGAIVLLYDERSQVSTSLLVCEPFVPDENDIYYAMKFIKFLVHTYFMVRAMVAWSANWYVELLTTPLVVGLFIQDIAAQITTHHLIAFQFCILHTFFCEENKLFYSNLFRDMPHPIKAFLKSLSVICLIGVFLAGSLRVAEEWETNIEYHPTYIEMPEEMDSLLSYIYYAFITLSTVGFGDISPRSKAGRNLMIVIVFSVKWFNDTLSALRKQLMILWRMKKLCGTVCLVIANCSSKHQLADILKHFEKSSLNFEIYLEFRNENICSLIRNKEVQTIQGFTDLSNKGSQDTILFLKDPTVIPMESDQYNLCLAKLLRGYSCKAKFLVEVNDFLSQQLVTKIQGWNDKNDICLSLEFIMAHIFALSSHSRLAAAFISSAVMNRLTFDDSGHHKANCIEELKSQFLFKGHVLLGYLNDENEIFFLPERTESSWTKILLEMHSCEEEHFCSCHNGELTDSDVSVVKTNPITSNAAIIGEAGDALYQALRCHNVAETDDLQADVLVFYSNNLLEFTEARRKHKVGQTRLVSMHEHGYDSICNKEDQCICGTYDLNKLVQDLLITAYTDPKLFAIWIDLVRNDYLQAEVVEVSCSYKNLFIYMITLGKVPVAIETNWPTRASSRMPLFNPCHDLILHKDDIVLYMQKPVVED